MKDHRIEGSVLVYILFDTDTKQWVVDDVTMDGTPLDQTEWMWRDDGWKSMTSECDCGSTDEEHEQAAEEALAVPPPTWDELTGWRART